MSYDAHFHLDLVENMTDFVDEMKTSKLNVFAVGTTPKAYGKVECICKHIPNIYTGLGLHPQLVGSGYDDISLFKKYLKECHYIGEVGLDFSRNFAGFKEEQVNVFDDIIRLCEEYGEKVVSIHSRKSVSKVLALLEKNKVSNNNKYIFHWFTGSLTQLNKAIELGGYFSVNSKMLKTKIGNEIIKSIPMERMLLETDAPLANKIKSVKELKKSIEATAFGISKVLGVDVLETVEENSKSIFIY